jgi:hypothetical protein
MWDLVASFFTTFLPLQFFFFTNYQDFIFIVLQHSPEISLAILDFLNIYWVNYTLNSIPSTVFDIFNDSTSSSLSEILDYFFVFFTFAWGVVIFLNIFRINKWFSFVESYVVRMYAYLFTTSKDNRIQLEASLTLSFIFIFYISMMIATFDDDQEELLEFFNTFSFYLFLTVFIYFLYKYSIHYFSFLEASKIDGRVLSLFIQFLYDGLNTFALCLRFGVLIGRLNLYDFLDDVLDSYYIFFTDFDDDEYYSDLIFSIFSVMFFDTDNNDDRSFFFEEEIDFSGDLFSLYLIVWSKFSLFFFFALEEIARVALAFYITYLIIFEMQAVNRSYLEDSYIVSKKVKSTNK